MEKETKQIIITGRVQGVFFRRFTSDLASRLHIVGFVRNEIDDSVYIEAQGKKDDMISFIQKLHQGPKHATVDHVSIVDRENSSYEGFSIL